MVSCTAVGSKGGLPAGPFLCERIVSSLGMVVAVVLISMLKVRDLSEAISFYTCILDFQLLFASPEVATFYAVLSRGPDEMHLSLISGRDAYGHCFAILVSDDVDALFNSFRDRGLSVPTRPDSPVHVGPLDQSWGTREFYVNDPSGNTLIFQQR